MTLNHRILTDRVVTSSSPATTALHYARQQVVTGVGWCLEQVTVRWTTRSFITAKLLHTGFKHKSKQTDIFTRYYALWEDAIWFANIYFSLYFLLNAVISSMEDNSYFIVQNCFHKFIICILQIIVHVKVYILKHFILYNSMFQHLKRLAVDKCKGEGLNHE